MAGSGRDPRSEPGIEADMIPQTWPMARTNYVGLYGPGQFIGLAALADGQLAFKQIAAADTPMLIDLLHRAIFVIHVLNYLIKVQTFTSARSRLAALLLLYEPICCGRDPLVPRGQLSAMAGVSSRMVSKILREWESAGIIRRFGRAGLDIGDRIALEAESAPLAAFPPPRITIPGTATEPDPRSFDSRDSFRPPAGRQVPG